MVRGDEDSLLQFLGHYLGAHLWTLDRFKPHLPKKQAPLAKHSSYAINPYRREKVKEQRKRGK